MKNPFPLHIFVICFVLFSGFDATIDVAASSQTESALEVSAHLKSKKIAVVRFFPLPEKAFGNRRPHERVFTGEFYTTTPHKLEDVEGIFVPNDYLEIVGNNINVCRIKYGLDINWTQSFSDVASDADLVIIGSVIKFSASNSKATVEMAVRLIDGNGLGVIADKVISKSIERKSKEPITFNLPFHTVGSLGSDFYLERYLLNLACYLSIQDLLDIIQANVR